jgi:hypothetical protein
MGVARGSVLEEGVEEELLRALFLEKEIFNLPPEMTRSSSLNANHGAMRRCVSNPIDLSSDSMNPERSGRSQGLSAYRSLQMKSRIKH